MVRPELRLCAVALAWTCPATQVYAEPPLITLDVTTAAALTAPQSDAFGIGGTAAAGVLWPLVPSVLLGGRLRAGALSNQRGAARPGWVDPGLGTFESASVVARLRPLADDQDRRRGVGLFVELTCGATLTGKDLIRGQAGAGLGYGLEAESLRLAPVVRYQQVIQPSDPVSDEDARILMLGLEAVLFDAHEQAVIVEVPQPVLDRDGDGLVDETDECPDEPEDPDGFLDDDGCPDPDNDEDGFPDVEDACPDAAEDVDDFQDQDGCPDPDNDGDGFVDGEDQCPNEAEIVNGNKDSDGCPDEGLIQMRDDRIVLEERVLFDFERARVKQRARPVLHAIVTLFEQHPEWTHIRIEGHADARGTEEYNQVLSQRRADNVRELLVRYGIPEGIIDSAGYGSSRPRDLRQEPEAYDRNRRVEFVVVARRPSNESDPAASPGEDERKANP